MNGLFKKYWYLLVLLFVLPIGLNFLLQVNAPYEIIGDAKVWLSVWTTYSASIIGSLITLFVLYKTLRQNEINNDESKNLQIAIFRKGLEERRIQELALTLKECLSYVDYSKLRNNFALTEGKRFGEVQVFVDNEMVRNLNAISSLSLDFICADKDEKEHEYKCLFFSVLTDYSDTINILMLINKLLGEGVNDGRHSNLIQQCELYNKKLKLCLFDDSELGKIDSSKNINELIEILTLILDNKLEAFHSSFASKHGVLIKTSKELISHKKELLEKITIG